MTKRAPPSLLRLLLVRIGGVVLTLLVIGGALSYLIARHYSDEVYDRWLYDSARTLAEQVHFVAQRPALDLPDVALDMLVWDENDQVYYEVISDQRGRIAGNSHFDLPAATRIRSNGRFFFDTAIENQPVRAVALAIGSPGSNDATRVIVGETLNKRTMLAGEILIATVPAQLLLIVAGALALWWSLRGSLAGVSATTAAIRARDPLDLKPLVLADHVPAEIAPLIVAINDLMARVDQAQHAQRRFVANAAHQLRTPVATLQVQIERALRERDAEGRTAALAHVDVAIKRLSHLLHQVLVLARVEPDGQSGLAFVPCNLADVAAKAVEAHIDDALARGCDLGCAGIGTPVIVEAEPTLLDELLGNLIENALQYGGAGSHVTVGVANDPPRLFVEDDGPGIRPSERGRVWERFYRAPGSVGFGCGLGLAIVKEIADRHKASASLDAMAGGSGTRVTVTFSTGSRTRPSSTRELAASEM